MSRLTEANLEQRHPDEHLIEEAFEEFVAAELAPVSKQASFTATDADVRTAWQKVVASQWLDAAVSTSEHDPLANLVPLYRVLGRRACVLSLLPAHHGILLIEALSARGISGLGGVRDEILAGTVVPVIPDISLHRRMSDDAAEWAGVLSATVGTTMFVLDGDRLQAIPVDADGVLVEKETARTSVPLARVRVSRRRDLGEEIASGPEATEVFAQALWRSRIALAAQLTAGARHVLNLAVEYAKIRVQFGRPIGDFQAIRHKLVDVLVVVDAADRWVQRATASACSASPALGRVSAVARAAADQAAHKAMYEAHQVLAGTGFMLEHELPAYSATLALWTGFLRAPVRPA